MSNKKPKAKKIRKIWLIKPASRVRTSRRKELLEQERSKDRREYLR